ncbi:AAA family ATPase [Candidatus Saccharibacteria bacterium]|nr:AAA family ATPase [Candidatus Saccharibacteria bacterium]
MNFADLILHSTSRQQLENYLKRPAHALLLAGENGVGLGTIAKTLAKEIAGTSVAFIGPTFHDKQKTRIINADDMRDLFELTRARRVNNFVILIDDADLSAAGVFERILKLLEEPIANVFYILTSHQPGRLPATIRSRTQTIEILPPLESSLEKLFEKEKDMKPKPTVAKLNQIKFLGNRRPAEITRLLTDEEYFRNRASVMNIAKNLVQGSPIDRLKIVADISAGKDARNAAIELAKNISKLLLLTTPRNKNQKAAAKNLETVSTAIDNLHQNGNVRAQLTHLALNI